MTEQRSAASIAEAEEDRPMRAKYVGVAVSWVISIACLWLLQSCYGIR